MMNNPQFLMLKSTILELFKRDFLSNSEVFQIQAFESFSALPAWAKRAQIQKNVKKAFLELFDSAKPLQKATVSDQISHIFSHFFKFRWNILISHLGKIVTKKLKFGQNEKRSYSSREQTSQTSFWPKTRKKAFYSSYVLTEINTFQQIWSNFWDEMQIGRCRIASKSKLIWLKNVVFRSKCSSSLGQT